MNEFFYVFASTAAALSAFSAWFCVYVWIFTKSEQTNSIIYKILMTVWWVLTLSFVIAGIATS